MSTMLEQNSTTSARSRPTGTNVDTRPNGHGLNERKAEDGASRIWDTNAENRSFASSGWNWVSSAAHALLAVNQANSDAFVKSTHIWATGGLDLGKSYTNTARVQFEEGLTGWKEVVAAKSPKDMIELQTHRMRNSFALALSESGKLAVAVLELTRQSALPIVDRVTMAREELVKRP